MSQAYKTPSGEILIAQDEVQAAAFLRAGFEPVEEQPKSRKKTQE